MCQWPSLCILKQVVDDQAFRRLVQEYTSMDDHMRQHTMLVDDLACPACQPSPHSLHVDGNHKLYTWGKASASERAQGHAGRLFEPDDDVQRHLTQLDLAGSVRVRGGMRAPPPPPPFPVGQHTEQG